MHERPTGLRERRRNPSSVIQCDVSCNLSRMSEAARIADQLARSLRGPAWHGPSLLEVLDGVTADEARLHPISAAHSIAELVLHVAAWAAVSERGLDGHSTKLPNEANWPPVGAGFDWPAACTGLATAIENLAARVARLSDEDLTRRVRGVDQDYSTYALLHGVVQHNLYHAGQMALLKNAIRGARSGR